MGKKYLKKVWLKVYLKCMDLKITNPVDSANNAVKAAGKQFPEDKKE
jgi:hypothetical protein